MHIFSRVAEWNAKRYDRQFNFKLTKELLQEELKEFQDSRTKVESVDALCDLAFVAIGGLWKLGTTEDSVLNILQHVLDREEQLPAFKELVDNLHEEPDIKLMCIVVKAFNMIEDKGVNAFRAFNAVCDSNDSKEIVKLAPNEKYDSSGKGPNYFEPKLEEIVNA